MSIELRVTEKDDPEFVRLAGRVINRTVAALQPKEIYLIEIHGWFDHKWLRFSGIGVVKFPTLNLPGGSWIESALDEFSQEQVTFPPFTPNRVIEQRYFSRRDNGVYDEGLSSRLIHRRQHTCEGLHRRVSDFGRSAIFGWYSSGTVRNDRGSLMLYSVKDKSVDSWFASFAKGKEWKLGPVKGIDRDRLSGYLREGAAS